MTRFLAALTLAAGLAQAASAQIVPVATESPAGTYRLDLAHSRVIFGLSHIGFSTFIGAFRTFDATVRFDPADPETMQVTATIDPTSIDLFYPDPALDFDAMVAGPDFLDAAAHPEISFASTAVALTGPDTADVTGDLTLHGVTRPVTLKVKFNGGYAGHPLDPGGARIGFSATGSLVRSDFGIAYGVPAPGTTMGVGDEVSITIEAEFVNPDAPKVVE